MAISTLGPWKRFNLIKGGGQRKKKRCILAHATERVFLKQAQHKTFKASFGRASMERKKTAHALDLLKVSVLSLWGFGLAKLKRQPFIGCQVYTHYYVRCRFSKLPWILVNWNV